MASRRNRGGKPANPFADQGRDDGAALERIDAELFGDLDRVGRPTVLNLDEIRRDGGTQPRETIDWQLVDDYAEDIQGGAMLPPVDVFYDGENYWLVDGFHRWHGHDQAGKTTIRAVIHQGTQRDAVLYSLGVNAEHGKRRTNEDKRRAVLTMLQDQEWGQWSDREIARQCKVSNQFVSNKRKELSVNDGQIDGEAGADETRKVRRGGTIYEQRVSSDERSAAQKPTLPTTHEHGEWEQGGQDVPQPSPPSHSTFAAHSEPSDPDRESTHYLTPEEFAQQQASEAANTLHQIAERDHAMLTGVRDTTIFPHLADLPDDDRQQLTAQLRYVRGLLKAEVWFLEQAIAFLEG